MQVNQKAIATGIITAEFYDQSKLDKFDKAINRFILSMRDKYPHLMKSYRLGPKVKTDVKKNVICDAGFNVFCRILKSGATSYGGEAKITKMALGTGAGTPSANDTGLFNEDYRNDTYSGSESGNVFYLTAIFTEGECSGNYTEFGNFIDDTELWSHIAGLNWVKDTNTALVVSCKYTFQSI
ncbi:MAG: hypothetical protein C4519_24410 [Desulfobacteraceae bacterium]|nr:MAG: hypothetical protein C4519_24410 [Desulfobacteraceae bacterium]